MNVNFASPLLWALMIGWIMTVVLHEFAHGIVAHWGGDYTIRERGGLSLNPLQYVNPMMSIVLPLVYLAMGGIPLPGGATYVRTDLLRSKHWKSAVSAAGPAMNLIIFFVLCIAIHPRVGWVKYSLLPAEWTNAQLFVAGLAFAQILSVVLNLMPIPPLDGFGIISPYLPRELREGLTQPPWGSAIFFGFILIMCYKPEVMEPMFRACFRIFSTMGIRWIYPYEAFDICLRGRNPVHH